MSFFRWFSGKSRQTRGAATSQAAHVAMVRDKLPAPRHDRLEPGSDKQKSELKSNRQLRREYLYEAIRESMTKSGILSASYKFKLLSFDQQGTDFLVMIDLTRVAGDADPKTAEMEALIVQSSKARHDIKVPAVYWRLNEVASVNRKIPLVAEAIASPMQSVSKVPVVSHEPIQADEVAAFQRALMAASSHVQPVVPEKNAKIIGGFKYAAQHKDFEDTHVSGSASYPALSNTQYGELH